MSEADIAALFDDKPAAKPAGQDDIDALLAQAMDTGAPKPAAPSRNAPNTNAINNTCNRASPVSCATESLMISNWPLATVSR